MYYQSHLGDHRRVESLSGDALRRHILIKAAKRAVQQAARRYSLTTIHPPIRRRMLVIDLELLCSGVCSKDCPGEHCIVERDGVRNFLEAVRPHFRLAAWSKASNAWTSAALQELDPQADFFPRRPSAGTGVGIAGKPIAPNAAAGPAAAAAAMAVAVPVEGETLQDQQTMSSVGTPQLASPSTALPVEAISAPVTATDIDELSSPTAATNNQATIIDDGEPTYPEDVIILAVDRNCFVHMAENVIEVEPLVATNSHNGCAVQSNDEDSHYTHGYQYDSSNDVLTRLATVLLRYLAIPHFTSATATTVAATARFIDTPDGPCSIGVGLPFKSPVLPVPVEICRLGLDKVRFGKDLSTCSLDLGNLDCTGYGESLVVHSVRTVEAVAHLQSGGKGGGFVADRSNAVRQARNSGQLQQQRPSAVKANSQAFSPASSTQAPYPPLLCGAYPRVNPDELLWGEELPLSGQELDCRAAPEDTSAPISVSGWPQMEFIEMVDLGFEDIGAGNALYGSSNATTTAEVAAPTRGSSTTATAPLYGENAATATAVTAMAIATAVAPPPMHGTSMPSPEGSTSSGSLTRSSMLLLPASSLGPRASHSFSSPFSTTAATVTATATSAPIARTLRDVVLAAEGDPACIALGGKTGGQRDPHMQQRGHRRRSQLQQLRQHRRLSPGVYGLDPQACLPSASSSPAWDPSYGDTRGNNAAVGTVTASTVIPVANSETVSGRGMQVVPNRRSMIGSSTGDVSSGNSDLVATAAASGGGSGGVSAYISVCSSGSSSSKTKAATAVSTAMRSLSSNGGGGNGSRRQARLTLALAACFGRRAPAAPIPQQEPVRNSTAEAVAAAATEEAAGASLPSRASNSFTAVMAKAVRLVSFRRLSLPPGTAPGVDAGGSGTSSCRRKSGDMYSAANKTTKGSSGNSSSSGVDGEKAVGSETESQAGRQQRGLGMPRLRPTAAAVSLAVAGVRVTEGSGLDGGAVALVTKRPFSPPPSEAAARVLSLPPPGSGGLGCSALSEPGMSAVGEVVGAAWAGIAARQQLGL
ncbi:hypothetical protein Agub_g12434 [Astrephomene gubernaculifera]|uniref:FCP1 homology domain-containing protein n=1 Tax=Astrephomene gubernaculifera TaxID=47775 RepID=A0AAD3DYM3_9CHLO|nr:hypothetical protein Agub_g12434 [Astrephomene gubernaculifera]